jgi:NAD(P)-dependent dehydrogenase (short-subunit alcohol dehydrogenase family)
MSMYTSTIVITGGTSGLGYETALLLAKSNPATQIVITGRTPGMDIQINTQTSQSNVLFIPCDLTSQSSTRAFLPFFKSYNLPPISAILLNAGYQVVDQVRHSPDGIEIMFAVNHVNHSLLFFLLAPYLQSNARVVFISSSTHDPKYKRVPPPTYTTGSEAAHPPTGKEYNTQNEGFRRYALSKLANILFAYSLDSHAKAAGKQWIITALDPGVMPTKLYRWNTGVIGWLFSYVLSSWIGTRLIADLFTTEFVAKTLADMAVGEKFGKIEAGGKYYQVVEGKELESSVQSMDKALWKDLWDWTIKQVSVDEAEQFKFDRLDF